MNSAHLVDRSEEPDSGGREEQVFAEFLKKRGLKYTQPRRELLKKIFSMHDHFTADQLLERLKRETIGASKATVYRTLAVMIECELLTAHDFGEGSLYYEHTFGHAHHDHLFCVACKRILEFRDDRIEALQDRVAEEAGFRILSHSLKLYGLCASCLSKEEVVARFGGAQATGSGG